MKKSVNPNAKTSAEQESVRPVGELADYQHTTDDRIIE